MLWVGRDRVGGTAAPAPSATSSSGPCTLSTLSIAAAPVVAPVIEQLARGLHDPCVTVKVTATEPYAFAQQASEGNLSSVWVPDTPLWVESLTSASAAKPVAALNDRGRIGWSPVLMAVPSSIATATNTGLQNWLGLLATTPVVASPPDQSTASVLQFTAVWNQLSKIPEAQAAVGDAFFQVVRTAVAPAQRFELASKPAGEARAFPASEQEVRSWNTEHPESAVKVMAPDSGAAILEFTWVDVGNQDESQSRASQALLAALQAPAGVEALRAAGVRAGDAVDPLVDGLPATLPLSPDITVGAFDRMRQDWKRISQPMNLLVAVDVSGSIAEPAGSTTRIALAVDAVSSSVRQMPPASKAGLWVFSSDLEPGGVDYRTVVPVAPLGTPSDPASHATALLSAVAALPTQLARDTGLNDTIWAAHQSQQASAGSSVESFLVVMTDGKNDDPTGGLSTEELIAKLKAAKNPDKPVRLVLLGIGPDTDEAAMRQITDAVGGQTQVATDPTQLTPLFASAVWSVNPGSWG